MLRIALRWSFVALALLPVAGTAAAQTAGVAPPAVCDDAASRHEKLQGLLALVSRLKDAGPLWHGYRPSAASYVFLIPAPEGERCAIAWRDGEVRAVFPLTSAPRFDTPLYGFYRSGNAANEPGRAQPAELHQRLAAAGIREAVLLPLDGDTRLGISMSSQSWFVDMAVHEAFHLLVQFAARSGVEPAPPWPRWTLPQPNREQLAARCYGSSSPQQPRLTAERTALQGAATGTLANEALESVCRDARAFVTERRRRWSELSAIEVPTEDGAGAMSCATAEAVMEMNEGVPSFVAWLTAHGLGVVDDKRLVAQFNVRQRDIFYMTGTMQLAVLRRLAGAEFGEITARLAASASSAGAIFPTLESTLSRRCTAPQ